MGTVVLKMSEEEFWNCTHKKLLALLEIDKEVNEKMYNTNQKELVQDEYIDNIQL